MVDALRAVREALVPGGVLLDLHPVARGTLVSDGVPLGDLDGTKFFGTVAAMEREVERARDLFEIETEVRLDVRERFPTGPDVLAGDDVEPEERVPPELERRLRETKEPVDVPYRVVLRRYARK